MKRIILISLALFLIVSCSTPTPSPTLTQLPPFENKSFFGIIFWQDFLSNLSATLLGVGIGIPVALFINRKVTKLQEKKELLKHKKALNQRKYQLLQLFDDTLKKNLELIKQIEGELIPEVVIFYNVDTQLLESTSSLKYEIIDDLELNRQIDSIRYELLHLHRKIELQVETEFSAYKYKRNLLVKAILEHLPRIKQEISNALKSIETQKK